MTVAAHARSARIPAGCEPEGPPTASTTSGLGPYSTGDVVM